MPRQQACGKVEKMYLSKIGVWSIGLWFGMMGIVSAQQAYDIKNTSSVFIPARIQSTLQSLAQAFFAKTGQRLMVTDGTRRAEDQAKQMYKKFQDGETEAAYANIRTQGSRKTRHQLAKELRELYTQAKKNRQSEAQILGALTVAIQNQIREGNYVSKHLVEGAIDLRSHGIQKHYTLLLQLAKERGVVVVDETRTPRPHYHLNFP